MKKELNVFLVLFLVIFSVSLFVSAQSKCEDAGYFCRDAGCPMGAETRVWDLSCSYQEGGRPQICCREIGPDEERGQCFDSDKGNNPYIAGETYNDLETYRDSCLVAGGTFKYITEYYCEGNSIKSEILECPNGCYFEGFCRGEVENCTINNGEGICEFSGKTYSVKHTGCHDIVGVEVSYDGNLVFADLSRGDELLLKDGSWIKVTSSPCGEYVAHLSFEKYRDPLIIIDYGIYTVYWGDKINLAHVNAEVAEISWALSGDTDPKIRINAENARTFSLKQNEERVFTYGPITDPLPADLNIKVIAFALDYGSPTKSHATIELSSVETQEVLIPTESTGPIERSEENTNFFCNGCELDNRCYPFGYRKSGEVCLDTLEFVAQLEEGEVCENNFECDSNVCISGECVSQSLIQKILDFFRRLFGGE